MRTLFRVVPFVLFFTTLGAGCIQFSGGNATVDGGVWETIDQTQHWVQRKTLLTTTGLQSIGNMAITTLVMDPQDHLAIYAGSDHGLLYTYDGADSWMTAKGLTTGTVTNVAVNPKEKCTIYVADGQKIQKTIDCNRSWTTAYFEGRPDVSLTSLMLDWYNPHTVYAGTSAGDLLKSTDDGRHWAPLQRFSSGVKALVIDPSDSRILYAGLRENGIWRSADGGLTWADLRDSLRDFDGARGLVALVTDKSTPNTLLAATKYGILRTTDSGKTWISLSLPTPPNSVTIDSLAVNPKSANDIYYGTASTLYYSGNGGTSWTTQKLPTSRAATAMLIDPVDSKIIYLGTATLKK